MVKDSVQDKRAITELSGLGKRKSQEGPSIDELRNALALSACQLEQFVTDSDSDMRYAKTYIPYLTYLLENSAKYNVLNFIEKLSP